MPLYLVQDSDRPLYIVADSWERAIGAWQQVILTENPPQGDDTALDSPTGVQFLCHDNEIVVDGKLRAPLFGESEPDVRSVAEAPDVSKRLNEFQSGMALQDREGRQVTSLRASETGQELLAEFERDNAEEYLVTPDEIQSHGIL